MDTQRSFLILFAGLGEIRFAPTAKVDDVVVDDLIWEVARSTKGAQVFNAENHFGTWSLSVIEDDAGRISVTLTCRLIKPPKQLHLAPVGIKRMAADHLLCQGRSMGECSSYLLPERESRNFRSVFLTSITRKGTTFQLSHPLAQEHLSDFSGQIKGGAICGLEASTTFDPCRGRIFRSAEVTLAASKDGHGLMRQWTALQVKDREPQAVPQESGWNSWDYYRWTISEDEVFKNAELIASDPVLSKHIKRIVIDDGWQHCYGEWEANFLFPSGMKKVAENLARMGFTPGLWFAPTVAEPHARIAQLNPEMLAKGLSGIPCLAVSCMARNGMVLDPTHHNVKAWWHDLFSRYSRWGFRYFKLDFLAQTLNAPVFSDSRLPKGQLMREIIDPIRKAVGKESRILACNYQFQGGVQGVDDVRVSADIHANWEAIKDNAISIAARFWSHRYLWNNDADFVLCRGDETACDPDLHRLKPLLVCVKPGETGLDQHLYTSSLVSMTAAEARVLLSLVIASGGVMNLSDNLPRLNATGLELARKVVMAEKGEAAVPIDLFRSKLPSYWIQQLSSGIQRVLLVNWGDQASEYSLHLTSLNLRGNNARDFWTDQPIPLKGGKLSVVLNPHSCLLAELK